MRSRGYVAAAMTAVVVVGVVRAPAQTIDVDATLQSYRGWKDLTPAPQFVPYELAIQCANVTPEQLERARKNHGPHTNRWIKVYANPLAAAALKDPSTKVFPVGSVIAKEKLEALQDTRTDGVAFMIKRPKGQFVESDGWEFRYRPPRAGGGDYKGCIACHRAGATKDYVFGHYGLDSMRVRR